MKKRLLLLECFFIIVTLITITKTYGLFETSSQATSDIPIAKWVIKVDGKDLTLAKELNYVPNYNAKSLVLLKSYVIGVFFSSISEGILK